MTAATVRQETDPAEPSSGALAQSGSAAVWRTAGRRFNSGRLHGGGLPVRIRSGPLHGLVAQLAECRISGYGPAWQGACMGCTRSLVQIQLSRRERRDLGFESLARAVQSARNSTAESSPLPGRSSAWPKALRSDVYGTLRIMKTCCGCKTEKAFADFHRRGDGYQALCKVCRTASDAARYASDPAGFQARHKRHRAEIQVWLWDLKRSKPCTDCGQSFHPIAMQWDHVGTDKSGNISDVAKRWGKKRLLAEIAKCELVCANCHAVRTYERAMAQFGSALASDARGSLVQIQLARL